MPDPLLYKEQTARALENFGSGKLPRDFICAFGNVKKACFLAAGEYKSKLDEKTSEAVLFALDKIITGSYDDHFILPLKQGGAGTSINMLFNEITASLAREIYSRKYGTSCTIDEIEDINRYQSTNDVFSTAVTILTYRHLTKIEQKIIELQELLITKENEYGSILMTGRTQLQSALPITLGQVFGSWAGMVERDRWRMNKLKERIRTIALGGTALGTSFFAPQRYIFLAEQKLRTLTGLPLTRSQNLPDEIANQDKYAELASGYGIAAGNLFKITGDLLLYTSSAFGELEHPDVQYGSTIMAAKTNPVLLEYVRGLALDIQGECNKIAAYSQNGQLQLNIFLPFITDSFITVKDELIKAIDTLIHKFFASMKINRARIEKNLTDGNTLLNTLIPLLGYNKVKELYLIKAEKEVNTIEELKQLVREHTDISGEELEYYFDPHNVTTCLRQKP